MVSVHHAKLTSPFRPHVVTPWTMIRPVIPISEGLGRGQVEIPYFDFLVLPSDTKQMLAFFMKVIFN